MISRPDARRTMVVVEWPSTRGMSTSRPPAASTSRAADDLLGLVVAPFDEDIGADRGDQLERGVFIEDRHGVDRLERAQDLGAGLGRVDRAAWSFQARERSRRSSGRRPGNLPSRPPRAAAAHGRDAAGRSSRW